MQQEPAARDLEAIRGEAAFGKLMGVLITLLLKILIPTVVLDAHPAAHILRQAFIMSFI